MATSSTIKMFLSILLLSFILLELRSCFNVPYTAIFNGIHDLHVKNSLGSPEHIKRSYAGHQADIHHDIELHSPSKVKHIVEKRATEALAASMTTTVYDRTAELDQYVLQLWRESPPERRVAASAPPKAFYLDSGNSQVFTTMECYGCTAVAIVSGQVVIIAHFVEVSGLGNNFKDDEAFVHFVITPLEAVLLANKDALGDHPMVVIFAPIAHEPTTLVPYPFFYPHRNEGPNSILDTIEKEISLLASATIAGYMKYHRTGVAFDTSSAGKLLIEWKAPNSPCGSNGIGQLSIYAEKNWIVNAFYDANGNPALEQGGRCEFDNKFSRTSAAPAPTSTHA